MHVIAMQPIGQDGAWATHTGLETRLQTLQRNVACEIAKHAISICAAVRISGSSKVDRSVGLAPHLWAQMKHIKNYPGVVC